MSNPAPLPSSPDVDFSSDDDGCLLYYMAQAGSDRRLAEAAFTEFVQRHWPTLIGFCLQQRYETFGEGAEDFVNATLLKAFEKASSFKPPLGANTAKVHRKAQNWLFTILQRLYLDARRRILREIKARRAGDEGEAPPEPSENPAVWMEPDEHPIETKREAVSARRRTLTDQFLKTLGDRDRAIFLQTQDYIDPATKKTEPSEDELDALAAQFGIPSDHIKVYRQRILQRLRRFIEQAEANSP